VPAPEVQLIQPCIPLLSLPDIRPNRIFIPTDGRHATSPCSEVLSGEVPLLLPGHSSHVDGTLDFDLGQRTRRSWIDLSCAWRLTKASVTMDRRIRQTFTVSPAQPGDYLRLFIGTLAGPSGRAKLLEPAGRGRNAERTSRARAPVR